MKSSHPSNRPKHGNQSSHSTTDEFGRDIRESDSPRQASNRPYENPRPGPEKRKFERSNGNQKVSHRSINSDNWEDRHLDDHGEEERRHLSSSRPPREIVSYPSGSSPSCFLLLTGLPVSITEDFISDSLKPFGPVIDVLRKMNDEGSPTDAVIVEYDSVTSCRKVLDSIERMPVPFKIQGRKPTLQYYHQREKQKHRPQPEEETPTPVLEDIQDLELHVHGLPSDYQSKFELESMICHILGAAHSSAIIRSVSLDTTINPPHTVAIIVFTDEIYRRELLRRTGGQIVLRGFPLLLLIPLPSQPPVLFEETPFIPLPWPEPVEMPQMPSQMEFFPQAENDSSAPILTCDHQELENNEESHSEAVPQVPIQMGPIEFSLKPTSAPSSKPRSLLISAPQSKLAVSSTEKTIGLTQTQANPMVAPTRGGRHFINIPAEKPARAELPPSRPEDPPFTRANICLLCRALFNSLEHIKRHVAQSPQHASKLEQFLEKHQVSSFSSSLSNIKDGTNIKKRPRNQMDYDKDMEEEYQLDDELPPLNAPPRLMSHPPMGSYEDRSGLSPSNGSSSANVGMKLMQKIGYNGGKLGPK